MRNDKYSLLAHISGLGLVVYDTKLYLNTHPECSEAREYLIMREKEYEQEVKRYESAYGPITHKAHPVEEVKWAWQIEE